MISLTNRKTKLPQLHDSDNRKPKHSILSHGIGVDTIQRGQKKKAASIQNAFFWFVSLVPSTRWPPSISSLQKAEKKGRVQK